MIENDGTMVHIDFGFIFGDSPGFNINFENAPFKLTKEYVDLMGGTESPTFKAFEDLFVKGYLALSRRTEAISAVVDLFYGSKRRAAAEGE
jgi:phosphatidylinositol 4-kinase B